jgi:hypothetical protein
MHEYHQVSILRHAKKNPNYRRLLNKNLHVLHIVSLIEMSTCLPPLRADRLEQCFSNFMRPRPGKFFFYKTRARSQQIIGLQAIFMTGHKQRYSFSRMLKISMSENSRSFMNTSMFKNTQLGHLHLQHRCCLGVLGLRFFDTFTNIILLRTFPL